MVKELPPFWATACAVSGRIDEYAHKTFAVQSLYAEEVEGLCSALVPFAGRKEEQALVDRDKTYWCAAGDG